jgi:hypothetical protein
VDELVLLAHHSVRQFLVSSTLGSSYEDAELELGELCIVHLYKHMPVHELTKYSGAESSNMSNRIG